VRQAAHYQARRMGGVAVVDGMRRQLLVTGHQLGHARSDVGVQRDFRQCARDVQEPFPR